MAQTERDLALETLRLEALKDTDAIASKQRFALFSSPAPLAIGDDLVYRHKIIKKDENGKVPTEPKNMSIQAPMQGKSKSSYFSLLGFTTIGDPYIEPEKHARQVDLQSKSAVKSDVVFKPASSYKTIIKSSYEHMVDFKNDKKTIRDADGKVVIMPRNMSTGGSVSSLYKPPLHMPEPYDREREFRKKDREAHLALMKDRPNLRTNNPGGNFFSSGRQAFGFEGAIPEKKNKEFKPNLFPHDNPFRPSHPPKSGLDGYIAKYPEYKGDPIRQAVRIDQTKTKDSFKINSPSILLRPTPSITMHPVNIRRDISTMSMSAIGK